MSRRRLGAVVMAAVSVLGLLASCSSAPDHVHTIGRGAHSVLDEKHGHGTIDKIDVPTGATTVPLIAHYDHSRHDAPWILYVHGGYWWAGNGGGNEAWFERHRVAGYQVFSVDYRLSQVARWPGPVDDVEAAISYLRAHAATYGLDPSRGVVIGFSAGGQLGTIAGLETGMAGIVDLDGAVDPLAALTAPNRALGRAARQLLGCAPLTCPARWQDARTVTHIDSTSPPMLIVHSIGDPTVPFSESTELVAALHAAGRPVELLAVPGKRHETSSEPVVSARVDAFLRQVTTRPVG